MKTVIAVLQDMIFESRIAAVAAACGVPVRFVRDPGGVEDAIGAAGGVLLDLNLNESVLELVRGLRAARPSLPMVGFLSHVQKELAREAAAAGVDPVLARSQFVQELPDLLVRLAK